MGQKVVHPPFWPRRLCTYEKVPLGKPFVLPLCWVQYRYAVIAAGHYVSFLRPEVLNHAFEFDEGTALRQKGLDIMGIEFGLYTLKCFLCRCSQPANLD